MELEYDEKNKTDYISATNFLIFIFYSFLKSNKSIETKKLHDTFPNDLLY